MADEKEINPLMKQVLELGPPILFFIVYFRIKDNSYEYFGQTYSGLIVATILFIPLILLAIAALWFLSGKISRMQVFTAVMVVVFGGLTAYLNDDRFIKIKTTIVYGLFAGLLGIGLLRGQSWLKVIMGELVPMEQEGWMILTKRLCAGFAVLAIVNEIIWRTMSEETWVTIETFGFPIVLMVFLFVQFAALQPYMIEEPGDDETPPET